MTTYDTNTRSRFGNVSPPPLWVCVLLGIVLVAAGILVLGDVVVATVVSTIVIGLTAIAAGAFEVIHAFWTKGWGGFVWHVLLGILYVLFGIALLNRPLVGALALTYLLGLLFLMSGIVRIVLGFKHWKAAGWMMLLSGTFGILAGLVVLTGFPKTGLWVLGFMLGVDLIFHGAAWLSYAFQPAAKAA